jgi:hypothetical protein
VPYPNVQEYAPKNGSPASVAETDFGYNILGQGNPILKLLPVFFPGVKEKLKKLLINTIY